MPLLKTVASASLQHVRKVCYSYGPPLPVGEQLRGDFQSKIFHSLPALPMHLLRLLGCALGGSVRFVHQQLAHVFGYGRTSGVSDSLLY